MTATTLGMPGLSGSPPAIRIGKAFVHPVFDLLVIGSLASILLTLPLYWGGGPTPLARALEMQMPLLVLLSNSAHFAASTMRLYTKPGALRELPFLTMGLPLVTLLVLTGSIVFASQLGPRCRPCTSPGPRITTVRRRTG
jgi:hypothetical protein